MNLHLATVSKLVAPGAHAVLELDGAGWHKLGGRLQVPNNISLLHLPPYSPELVWGFWCQAGKCCSVPPLRGD